MGNGGLDRDRLRGLDGLRAFAILPVLFVHAVPDRMPGGWLGVELFFVISGYIITLGLLAEHERSGRIDLVAFYGRRFRRLGPALLMLIAFVVVAGTLIGDRWTPIDEQRFDALAALTSTMNLRRAFGDGGQGYLGHSWSLSLEEQFYLVWPACLVVMLARLPRRRMLQLLLLAIVVATLWRGWLLAEKGNGWRIYAGFDTQADALLAGCLLAVAGTSAFPRRLLALWFVPAGILVLMVLTTSLASPIMASGGYSLIVLCAFWLVAVAVENRGVCARFLAAPPMQWIGLRSYSLYLWHVPALGLVSLLELKVRYSLPIFLILSFVAAEASYRWIERPFRQRRALAAAGETVPVQAAATAPAP